MRRSDILIRDILRWADAYFAHWGHWPTRESGPVSGQIDLTRCGIDTALSYGNYSPSFSSSSSSSGTDTWIDSIVPGSDLYYWDGINWNSLISMPESNHSLAMGYAWDSLKMVRDSATASSLFRKKAA
jgi:hypothetical protein